MSRPVLILTVTSLVLAAATAYLAFELHAARRESAGSRNVPAPVTTESSVREPAPALTAVAAPPASGGSNSPQQEAGSDEPSMSVRAHMTAVLPYLKATLEDPEKRTERMRESRINYRRIMPRLAEHLGLSSDEYDRLLDLIAEQEMRYLELSYQCALNPNCERTPPQGQINERELSDLLGPDKARHFSEYRDNIQERRQVSNMRGDLPDALRMTDVQAEKLVAALGEERRRALKEWELSGAGFEALNSEYGEVYHSGTDNFEQRVAETTELHRRQHDRAAQVLTAEQLKIFDERQAAALEVARRTWQTPEQEGNTQ